MKKIALIIALSLIWTTTFAQWTTNGNNLTTDKNIGVGTNTPQYKLDVNGTIQTKDLIINYNSLIGTSLSDTFTYKDKKMGFYSLAWMNDAWNLGGPSLWQSSFGGIKFFTQGQYRLGITAVGDIGIGTDDPQAKLDVKGSIRATEVKIEDVTNWSDFVFDKDYELPSLSEVEMHINTHKHLPDVPSEAEVKEDGINVVEMQAKLLQKIEELTLYVIKQDKEIQELKKSLLTE